MKVIDLRIVVPNDVAEKSIMAMLEDTAHTGVPIHGAVELASDGFGRLSADMSTAQLFSYATDDEYRAVHHGLSHGVI